MKYWKWVFASTLGILVINIGWWCYALVTAPVDAQQGMVYKIIYAHVPCAFIALGVMGVALLVTSGAGLLRPTQNTLAWQRASVEVGLLFTVLTLITGSIWGRPTWGTWWTWDARLTTTLLLAILQFAYLLMHASLEKSTRSVRICSILGFVICIDIPIIYKSVSWWRSLHQPAAIIAERGRNMDPEMLRLLVVATLLLSLLGIGLWILRAWNLQLANKVDEHLLEQIAQRG